MKITTKVLRSLISLIFFIEGSTKLLGFSFQIQNFTGWGYPLWFMYVVGIVELISAILLWTKFSLYAQVLLLCVMAGAFYTHISHGESVQMMGLAILSTLLILINLFISHRKSYF